MIKVIKQKIKKVWGYELWLYSPMKGRETMLENGQKVVDGPLIKIIKADQPLSVQVHPDDRTAQELESQPNGKSESWYILDAAKDAQLVLGLKTYDREKILEAIKHKTFKNLLKEVKVFKHEFYDVPAGLVHGIGAGVTTLEVQQPSDTTYRYYDYDRLENGKPRELHIEKAIKVQKQISFHLEPFHFNPLTYQNNVATQTFLSSPTTLKKDCIVIDLINYDAYVAKKGEKVNFKEYAIVSDYKK